MHSGQLLKEVKVDSSTEFRVNFERKLREYRHRSVYSHTIFYEKTSNYFLTIFYEKTSDFLEHFYLFFSI